MLLANSFSAMNLPLWLNFSSLKKYTASSPNLLNSSLPNGESSLKLPFFNINGTRPSTPAVIGHSTGRIAPSIILPSDEIAVVWFIILLSSLRCSSSGIESAIFLNSPLIHWADWIFW